MRALPPTSQTSSRPPTRHSSGPSTASRTRRTPSRPSSPAGRGPTWSRTSRSTPRAWRACSTGRTSVSRSRCTPRPRAATPTSPSSPPPTPPSCASASSPGPRPSPTPCPRCTRPTGQAASSGPPGGPDFALANVALMRIREVEIHHADLGVGYSPGDWPEPFRGVLLLDSMTKRPYRRACSVRPTDLDRTWRLGEGTGGAVVTGTSADLGWWLTGRGAGEGLASDTTDGYRRCSHGERQPDRLHGGRSPGGAPDVRRAGCVTITKVAVDPDMSNNCYLLHCGETDERVLVDAAAEPERLLELIGGRSAHLDRHHAPALGPPPCARRGEGRPPGGHGRRRSPRRGCDRGPDRRERGATCRRGRQGRGRHVRPPRHPARRAHPGLDRAPPRRRGGLGAPPPVHRRLPLPRRTRADAASRRTSPR